LLAVGILCGLAIANRLSPSTAILSTVLILVATIGLYLNNVLRVEKKLMADGALIRKSMSYGFIIFVGTVANALHFKIDQIMINVWLGSDQLGIYATAIRWAEFLFVLDSALGSAAIYRIGSSSATDSHSLSKKLILLQFAISAAAGVFLAVFAEPLVSSLYGPAFREAAWPLIILIPGIVFWSVSKIASTHFSYNRKQAHVVVSVAIAGTALNAALNVLFIRGLEMGLAGAAVASTISYAAVAIFILLRFYRSRRIRAQS
jgi:O-antigen/teichoic acid export membrane protein